MRYGLQIAKNYTSVDFENIEDYNSKYFNKDIEIYIDGKLNIYLIFIDLENNYGLQYRYDESGKVILDNDYNFSIEKVYGKIEIKVKSE